MGEEGLSRLRKARVTIIGLGGVGSHAAHLLARSGIGYIRLVDFDRVTLSSLNRHALANRSDVGSWKATVLAEKIKDFTGNMTSVEAIVALCEKKIVHELVQSSDFVLDCIDDQVTKIDLLEACNSLKIPVISSLGAGGKVDPTRIRISRLSDSSFDPLAARLRARIQHEKRNIDFEQIEVVYSSEVPKASLLALNPDQTESPQDYGALPHFRLRIMPVLGTSPALFGISMAARVLTIISKSCGFTPMGVDGISKNLAHSCIQRIQNRETKVFGRGLDRLTEEDANYVAILCRKRCVFTATKMGASDGKMELARWWPDRPLDVLNCILAKSSIVEKIYQFHERKTGLPPSGSDIGIPQQAVERVEAWLEEEKTLEFGI